MHIAQLQAWPTGVLGAPGCSCSAASQQDRWSQSCTWGGTGSILLVQILPQCLPVSVIRSSRILRGCGLSCQFRAEECGMTGEAGHLAAIPTSHWLSALGHGQQVQVGSWGSSASGFLPAEPWNCMATSLHGAFSPWFLETRPSISSWACGEWVCLHCMGTARRQSPRGQVPALQLTCEFCNPGYGVR
jgi:hypothetical protein